MVVALSSVTFVQSETLGCRRWSLRCGENIKQKDGQNPPDYMKIGKWLLHLVVNPNKDPDVIKILRRRGKLTAKIWPN